MPYRDQRIGSVVRILLPSLKLKNSGSQGRTIEEDVHRFFTERFGGYTAASANLFGYWKDRDSRNIYGEHREFTVALTEHSQLEPLRLFLGELAAQLAEDCIYYEVAGDAHLLYPD